MSTLVASLWRLLRRRGITAGRGLAAALGSTLSFAAFSPTAGAQSVILPPMRTSDATLAVQRLNRLVKDGRARWAQVDSSHCVDATLYRIAQAQLKRGQLPQPGDGAAALANAVSIRGIRLTNEEKQSFVRLAGSVRQDSSRPDPSHCPTVSRAITDTTKEGREKAVSERETGALVTELMDGDTSAARVAYLDTLGRVARLVVIERKLESLFFPVRTHDQAARFWRQPGFSTLNVGSISGSGKEGAAFTELAAPLLHSVRVSINSVISTSTAPEDKADTGSSTSTISRFLNGGGLMNVSFALPMLHVGRRDAAADLMVLAVPRVGMTVPAIGITSQRDSTLSYDLGTEIHLKSVDLGAGFGTFAQTRIAFAGGTQQFGKLLGVMDGKNHLAYSTVAFGFYIGHRYLITANRAWSGPQALRDLGWRVGFTVASDPEASPQ